MLKAGELPPARLNGPSSPCPPAYATLGPFASFVDGANAMRSVLALGLLIAVCASAVAATVRHSKPQHHVSVRRAYDMAPRFVVPPRVYSNDIPSPNDPSKFGGQSLGMDP
jgi:hypothetical protein